MRLKTLLRRDGDFVRTDFSHYLRRIGRRTGEGDVVVYFDLDHTLIAGYSVSALVWERIRGGSVSLRRLLSSASVFLNYGLGRADYHELLSTTVRDLGGESAAALAELGERAFRRRIFRWIYAEATSLISAHRQAGHHLVIVTSATRYQADPIARALGVDELCCTELEVRDGRITGTALPCFGPGKLAAAEHLAHQRRADMERAYFYSDSSDDLPLLEAVGRPVVVNPKPPMARLARDRGWPCLVFDPPSRRASVSA